MLSLKLEIQRDVAQFIKIGFIVYNIYAITLLTSLTTKAQIYVYS